MAAALVYLTPAQDVFGTTSLGLVDVAVLLLFPIVVWGADEIRRYLARRKRTRAEAEPLAAHRLH